MSIFLFPSAALKPYQMTQNAVPVQTNCLGVFFCLIFTRKYCNMGMIISE